ncbi:ubiquitin carrier protein [Apodospora peruviana]|uniref:Ubiquitin carrier protein n=1 Tax=Apodospora peruviana TaxID=516989 RepID=A0AAE0I5F5_9PEZI|nr:ubiquitin carrier protein [Apodospora peruviana]
MVQHVSPFVGAAIAKRFYDEPKHVELPGWSWIVFVIDALLFAPLFLYVAYTLGAVLPTLAMVEDPNPPAYEALAVNEDAEPAAGSSTVVSDGKPVTSSIRATTRLLRSIAGWRALFRGIVPAFAAVFATQTLAQFVGAFGLPAFVGTLVASLALVQLSTVWVHVVISAPNPRPFYCRLPPLRKTFEATCFPVLINWAAVSASASVPILIAKALGLEIWNPRQPNEVPKYGGQDGWKVLVMWLVAVSLHVLLVVPSTVVLVRVQASLLPQEDETVVPFDSSFQGRVGPAVVDGKGFVTARDALATFGRSSWIRLVKLYIKTWAVGVAAYFVVALVLLPEMWLILSKAK